jgi:opacity protein-like surface antigen
MKLSAIALCSAALLGGILAAPEASAQVSRIYMAGYMGLNTFGDQDFTDDLSSTKGTVQLNNAPSFASAIGLRLSRDIRVEAELSYRNSEVSQVDFPGASSEAGGRIKQYLGFLNVYYDFSIPGKIQPFVNAGLGMGMFSGSLSNSAGGPSFSKETTTAMAWNAGAGIKYRTRDDLAFTAGYRYVDTTDLSFGDFDIDYGGHEFRIGVEYDF